MNDLPLISCICITNNRPQHLKKAIRYFAYQSYQNKELVISYPINDKLSKATIRECLKYENFNILQIERTEMESVGYSRNTCISKCNGVYICIWDDDDWYHSDRILYQFQRLNQNNINYQANILTRILLYDEITKKTYYSFKYTWDGTIMCRKEFLLQNQYANSNYGEDTHVISFLSRRKLLFEINDCPHLYIYIYITEVILGTMNISNILQITVKN